MTKMTANEKVLALFKFIKDLGNIRSNQITDVKDQFWYKFLSDIPEDSEFVSVHYRDTIDGVDYDDIILEVSKPPLFLCPEPDSVFKDWLNKDWDNPYRVASCIEKKQVQSNPDHSSEEQEQEQTFEFFSDDDKRVQAFENWKPVRDEWAAEQIKRTKIRDLFTSLYMLHVTLERDTDTRELLIGSGLFTDRKNRSISHPVLLKRVKTEFDAIHNTIRIVDTDKTAELYASLLTNIEDLTIDSLPAFSEKISVNDYHPLDRIKAEIFLTELIHSLSSDSQFVGSNDDFKNARFQIKLEPVLFERARRDGAPKMVEAIIDDIQNDGTIPNHLINLVGEGKINIKEDNIEKSLPQQLAEVGGEDPDILLTKPANKEQLEIARRISNYDAVLVQGPPGTGKTHTIANLLGHFLAQGKTVLVTSYTKKALSVVKGQVEKDLQDLCVSVLDDDNRDMEKSVNGISDMVAKHSEHEIEEYIQDAENARKVIIRQLSAVRQRIFEIKESEFSASIVIGGKGVTPSEAARFVREHADCDIIPGKVELYRSLPLSDEELQFLYNSNAEISSWEESEMECQLADPSDFPTPESFSAYVEKEKNAEEAIKNGCADCDSSYRIDRYGNLVIAGKYNFKIKSPSSSGLNALKQVLKHVSRFEDWMVYAAVDGRAGGGKADNWHSLISVLEKTVQLAESVETECLGKKIAFTEDADLSFLSKTIPSMIQASYGKDKLGKLAYMLHPDYKTAENMVSIDGQAISGYSDYRLIERLLKLIDMRKECERFWNELLASHGLPSFDSLDSKSPERVAVKIIPLINKYLSWYKDEYATVLKVLHNLGISEEEVFSPSPLDTDVVEMRKVLESIDRSLPLAAVVIENYLRKSEIEDLIDRVFASVLVGPRAKSVVCRNLKNAVESRSDRAYQNAYQAYKEVYAKLSIRSRRALLLEKLGKVAPDWASSIQKRDNQHGLGIVPANIEDAWLWKQYSLILEERSKESLAKLQADSVLLSRKYREKTSELAKWKAWYALKQRIDRNLALKTALKSWALAVKKVGKAAKLGGLYKQAARQHMIACQEAVPVWIMPVSRVFESYTPGKNSFDVIIVDEASQSDITALAITYLGKKIIIVGDDKQVSPSGIGVDLSQMLHLSEGTIKDRIPSWELYASPLTSLYDIVSIAYSDLMLREHFRCVPDIIGYSNRLSYDYKIKPLRDTSDCVILPAVVNYRVNNGHRDEYRKQNDSEARTIIALLKACIERKEYEDKTFGIISLLGDEQVKLIEKYLFQQFGADIIENRRIIYGTSAQFQGDERDVVFLSMVDSNENESGGPIKLMGNGSQDANRKRYNVAASRAKDQLWIVNSLDPGMDLKDGDIRKGLLDYATNPHAYQQMADEVASRAESPFEEGVGKALVAKGYSLVQQWPVGAYRIDMVVIDGKKRIAIECDGEQWHSTDIQVRKDMERQTILERLGWRFIRIRGSEYYRKPEETMERVFKEIEAYDIHPINHIEAKSVADSQLLTDIKRRVEELLTSEGFAFDTGDETATVRFALDSRVSRKKQGKEDAKPEVAKVKPTKAEESIKKVMPEKTDKTAIPKSKGKETKPNNPEAKRTHDTVSVRKSGHKTVKQPSLFDGIETSKKTAPAMTVVADDPIIAIIREKGIEYVDNRPMAGSLWIIGGQELEPIVKRCASLGAKFKYMPNGGKATKSRPAWWTK